MQKNLVIVESPAKAKTIEKFLGSDYKVMSSYGHIRDLKKKSFSIDVENNFEPEYEIPADKRNLVAELKSEAKKADIVWLASDEDREGEAISWHLYEVLGLDKAKTRRIVFHEITKTAILKAIEEPRSIDINLVNAQQARRILDRIVGFELSPVLWKKVKPSLSAGRVQSVAVRLIVEREREIQNFKSTPSFRVTAVFLVPDENGGITEMKAELNKRLKTKEEAQAFLEKCKDSEFLIENITTKPSTKSPAAPFTTSTLQQEAARKLGMTVAQTMMVAQRLYESGLITYMRTDSVNLSSLAINTSKEAIINMWGAEYSKPRNYATKTKGAQEAHEAIRPTDMKNSEISGTSQEQRLYDLIWKRTIASQMAAAQLEKTTVTIDCGKNIKEKFTATGEVIKFDGFLHVYRESLDDEDLEEQDAAAILPPMKVDQVLESQGIIATERFTLHPPRYTEASLVRKMEELGIGRPSTYAPTISTIQQRQYVEKGELEGIEREYQILILRGGKIKDVKETEIVGREKNKLMPTDIGIVVNDFLNEFFPEILDYNFTASIEKEFDEVATGHKVWTDMMHVFYNGFHPAVESTLAVKMEHKVGERLLGDDPKTGKPVSVKIGRYGPIVQIGSSEDEEKPQFSSLRKGQSIETISLDEALELFKLPRELGELEGSLVTIGVGRFGPYILHNKKYTSIPKTYDPMEITLDEAIELIKEKREQEAKKHIKYFKEDPDLEIKNGRYGPYIAYKGKNYKIPKDIVPEDLSHTACLNIIEADKTKSETKKGKAKTKAVAAPKKKAAAKKTTAKKTTTKKEAVASKTTKKATAKK